MVGASDFPNLAGLCEQLTASAAGSGRVVLISGGIASGKTRLLHEFIGKAIMSGALVLSATGAADEQRLSAGIIDQLFVNSALPPAVSQQVAEVLRPVRAGPLDDDRPDTPPAPGMNSTIREICQILLRLASKQLVVIGIDDVQFADSTSLQLLLQLQRRIRSTRLLVVLSHRDRPVTTDQRLQTFFANLPHDDVRLAPMSKTVVRHLLDAALPHVDHDLVTGVHELSGGSPMLVKALVDDCRDGDRGGQPVIGPAFSRAVSAFLRRGGSPLLEVAAALAVLGRHGTPESAAHLAGVTTQVAGEMTATLTGIGLLRRGVFQHADPAAEALSCLASGARAELHVRAAEWKHRRAAAAVEVAAHLVAAGRLPAGWQVEVLRKAAEHAILADNVGFAGLCLELALTACDDTRDRRAILNSLARITWRVHPAAASVHLSASRRTEAPETLEYAEPDVLARHALWCGDDLTFTGALDTLSGAPDRISSQTAATMALAFQWHFGPHHTRDHRAVRQTDPWHTTAATLARVWTVGRSDATTASAELILRNCSLDDMAIEALSTAIIALAYDGRGDRAEHWCAVLREEAARRGGVAWQAMFDGLWAGVILRRGDIAKARARARSALDLLGTQDWGVSIGNPLTTLILADTAAGAFDAVAETLRHPVPDAMLQTVGGLRYLRARGQYHLATDRVLAAISDFQECQRLMGKRGLDLPVLAPWRTDLAAANLRLGNIAIARDLAEQQLQQSPETDTHSRGLALRILGLTSSPADRPALLAQAVELFEKSGDRLEVTRTLQAPGQDHQPVRRLETAQAHRPRALHAVPESGSAPDLRTESGGSTALSEAELRVAQLAVLGQTNQQIGRRLFITISTVEQHLTRIYRKLGIKGRSELPTDLASTA